VKKRCAVCRKVIGKRVLYAPDGAVFDFQACLDQYDAEQGLRALQNVVRVMRARLKARAIQRAGVVYHGLGGQDWVRVQRLLAAIL
jgi:hypothetical protein